MQSYSPSTLIIFELLMLPVAVTSVGIAGSGFTGRQTERF